MKILLLSLYIITVWLIDKYNEWDGERKYREYKKEWKEG